MKMTSVPTTKPPEGFKRWIITPPPHDATVAYWREGMAEPKLLDVANVHPAMNVYNAYWAPASALSEPVTKAIN